MKFTKVQGAGNDFVVIDADSNEYDWTALARSMCDRHFGVGADGLLAILTSKTADFRMRVFNLDGSEADACGNGLRCVVRYALEKGIVEPGQPQLTVETMAGVRRVLLSNDAKPSISVYMGQPVFHAADIPVIIEQGNPVDITHILDYPLTVEGTELSLNIVSMGNPHAVNFINGPVNDFPLWQIGPKVEAHRIFPKRVNFEVARLLNRNQIEARVWERGVGETMACGSGACAIAVMARLHNETNDEVDINLPGGTLRVFWKGSGDILLSGPAEIVYDGFWPD